MDRKKTRASLPASSSTSWRNPQYHSANYGGSSSGSTWRHHKSGSGQSYRVSSRRSTHSAPLHSRVGGDKKQFDESEFPLLSQKVLKQQRQEEQKARLCYAFLSDEEATKKWFRNRVTGYYWSQSGQQYREIEFVPVVESVIAFEKGTNEMVQFHNVQSKKQVPLILDFARTAKDPTRQLCRLEKGEYIGARLMTSPLVSPYIPPK